MEKIKKMNFKKTYFTPSVEHIKLDTEITLIMESEPPIFETKNVYQKPDNFSTDHLYI